MMDQDTIVPECESCGKDMPKWKPEMCCRGAIDYCDCGGMPQNECICEECEKEHEDDEE